MYNNLISSNLMNLKRESSINLIEQNDMVLIFEPKTLFQFLSTLLFQTDIFQQQIKTLCLQQFKQIHKTINNVSSLAEYIINQQSEEFEYFNLELIFSIFKVKIELYFIDDGLLSMIVNHGYNKTIRMFKEDYNYYELQTNSYRKKFKFIRKLLDQTINSFLQISKSHSSLNKEIIANDLGNIGESVQIVSSSNFHTINKKIYECQKSLQFSSFFRRQSRGKRRYKIFKNSSKIIQSQPERVIGYLKFYNESKKYGFFLDDKNNKDIFVHQDDFNQSCVDPEFYEKKKKGLVPYFSYQVIIYQGKTQQNVKAIDIKFEKYDKLK
ncbi:unnamed protein product [Paramecium sonneborni]|uniref:CSD domain-containing protein n=1 Tax=Paramecium sonneborni TaxID=65129 RepID=A0A8S1QM72_9CILI|nr:unnamed protein product [Paramecium sonneborni]